MNRALVARKVIQATWAEEPVDEGWIAACVPLKLRQWRKRVPSNSIFADAIDQVRSTDNTLSLWVCDGLPTSVDEVALAFAAGMKTVSKLDLALVPIGDVTSNGLHLKATEGKTPVVALRDRHRDLVELSLDSLSCFARVLAWHVRYGRCVKYTRGQVRGLLLSALDSGALNLADLRKELRKELEEAQLQAVVLPVISAEALNAGLTAADAISKSRKGGLRVELYDGDKVVGSVAINRATRTCTIQSGPEIRGFAKSLEAAINAGLRPPGSA